MIINGEERELYTEALSTATSSSDVGVMKYKLTSQLVLYIVHLCA